MSESDLKSHKENKSIDKNKTEIPNTYWPSMLVEIRDCVEAAFIEQGESKERAIKLASVAVITWADLIGGQFVYIPRGVRLNKFLRDAEIFSLFDGENTIELSIKFKLSRQTIYAVLKEQRELKRTAIKRRAFL